MAITATAAYQQVLSMALEERSPGYQDLVSDNNALLATLKRKGLWKSYSGPRIRETLQIDKADAQWYNSFDFLNSAPVELFNDAYFTPKMVAVPITLSMEEILNNEGESQIMDVMESYIEAAESSLMDTMDEALHGDGTANGGKAINGLAVAVPITTNAGVYGGISRVDQAIWRTNTYNIHSYDTTIGTQWSATTVRPFLNKIMTARSRGKRHADLLLASPEVYSAYDAATVAVQRIQKEGGLAKLGFSSLEYVGGGKTAEIVLDGGIGSNMPADTVFGLDTKSLRVRFNANRNFSKLFEGDGQKPINQDAIQQFIGWMGEFTMNNPLFNWRAYDATPAS
jgi:hypothetical protein